MTGRIENQMLIVKKIIRSDHYPVKDIVWAYLQVESTSARMCCGSFDFPIGRLMLLLKDGKKLVLQYEGTDEPKALLEELKAANPEVCVGYTEENKQRFAASLT